MKMNWNEIKEKYPKAFHKMHQWHYKDLAYKKPYPPIVIKEYNRLQERDANRFLYDFFDEQDIYISINVNMFMMFDWSIITTPDVSVFIQSDFDYNFRTEAEKSAFLKAFKILENKLNENH